MIIDFHTHIFPTDVCQYRGDYLRRDPTFAEMYTSPRARVATAEDLLRSMDEAGVDKSVILAFAWRDHELCVRHNDYLLEAAAGSGGRLIPFCMVNPLSTSTWQPACLRYSPRSAPLRPRIHNWASKPRLSIITHSLAPLGNADTSPWVKAYSPGKSFWLRLREMS